jgi:polyferredoxin
MPAPTNPYAPLPRASARPARARRGWRRHLRRWGPYWILALALLAASQMLWLWQSWPVRELLAVMGGSR